MRTTWVDNLIVTVLILFVLGYFVGGIASLHAERRCVMHGWPVGRVVADRIPGHGPMVMEKHKEHTIQRNDGGCPGPPSANA